MTGNKIVFALNDLFNDDDRKIIVSFLLKHPLAWNFLDSGDNFEQCKTYLGNNPSNWTLLKILLSANHISPTDEAIQAIKDNFCEIQPDNKGNILNLEVSDFRDLFPLIQQILKKFSCEKNWGFVKEYFEQNNLPPHEIIKKFGTLLSIMLEIEPASIHLLSECFDYQSLDDAAIIAANVIFLSAKDDHSLKTIFNAFKDLVNPNIRIGVLNKLKLLGVDQQVVELALEELGEANSDKDQNSSPKHHQIFDHELMQLSILKNKVELFNLAGSREQADVALKDATGLARRILVSFDKLNDYPSELGKIHQSTSESETPPYLQKLEDKVKLFNKIYESDQTTASQLAVSISKSFDEILHNDEFLNRIEIIKLDEIISLSEKFLKLGLIYESRKLADSLFEHFPQNIQIIKFLAHINYEYGDKFSSTYYFGLIESLTGLNKDEKVRFADALSDSEFWTKAEKIYAELALKNPQFLTNQLICLYQSTSIEEALVLLKNHEGEFRQDDLLHVITGLIFDKAGRHIDANGEINKATLKSESGDDACVLAAEYFLKNKDFDLARKILAKYTEENKGISKSAVKLVKILREIKDDSEAERVISTHFSDLLVEKKEILKYILDLEDDVLNPQLVREIYLYNKKKWLLMSEVIAFQAHELLENNQFNESRKLLEMLVSRDPKNQKWIIDYCLSFFMCSNQDFPIGIRQDYIENLPITEKKRLRDLIFEFKNNPHFQLIDYLLGSDNSLENLSQVEKSYEDKLTSKNWQTFAYIGKRYFDKHQYDHAIFYLEKAAGLQSTQLKIHLTLITAYLKLNLWHEAQEQIVFIYPKINNNLVLVKQIFDCIDEQTLRLDILNKLKLIDPGNRILETMHIFENIRNREFLGVKEHIQKVFSTPYLSNELIIFLAQLLIESEEYSLAKWAINKILSSRDIREDEYLSVAILLIHMDEQEKAFQCASFIANENSLGQTIKAWLQIDSNIQCDHESLVNEINQIVKSRNLFHKENSIFSLIKIPSSLLTAMENPDHLTIELIRSILRKNCLKKAFEVATISIEGNPNDENIILLWLEMSSILGDSNQDACVSFVPELINKIENINDFNLKCNLLENSLANNYEVQVADQLARMDDKSRENPRVQLISARLMGKTGHWEQARAIVDGIYEEFRTHNTIPENLNDVVSNSNPLFSIWFLETAFELKDYTKILELGTILCNKGLITNRIAEILLKSLVSCLEMNFLLDKIGLINKQTSLNSMIIQSVINGIANDEKVLEYKNNLLLHRYCRFLIDESDPELKDFIETHIAEMDAKSYIYAAKRLNKTISLDIQKDPNDENVFFYYAVLNYKEDRDIAIYCITELLKRFLIKPEYYLILSLIKLEEGSIEEAFSAINLALEIENHEPSLLNHAGEIADLLGDDLAAIRFYEKSIQYFQDNQVEDKLIGLYIKTNKQSSLGFIEKNISRYSHDAQVLNFLAESYLTKNDYRKATFYANQLIDKKFFEATILKSRIACELGSYDKAEEIISRINQSERNRSEYITQKAMIIEAKGDLHSAINYLDEAINNRISDDEPIIILKAKYLEKLYDPESALQYLKSINENDQSITIKLLISDILIRLEQLDQAQFIIEKELDKEPKNSELYAKMAIIAKSRGDLDQAVNYLVSSIQYEPYASKYYIELAKIYLVRRETKKGLEILNEAQRVNPHDAEISKAMSEIVQFGSQFINTKKLEPMLSFS